MTNNQNYDHSYTFREYSDTILNSSTQTTPSSAQSQTAIQKEKGHGDPSSNLRATTTTTTTTTTKATKAEAESDTSTTKEREPRLGDGCYNVFLDIGANVGVHGRFLMEPHKYPNSTSSVALFEKEYGRASSRNNKDYCVFEFEANSKHWPRLTEISNAYAQVKGWRYHVVKAAVSDRNGSMTFFHQGTEDNASNEWGFSGAKDLRDDYNGKVSEGGWEEQVPTIRLSEWIQYHILEREVPTISSNSNPPQQPVLGMKIDIEGSEYVVLPDLIHSTAICNFDFFFGEFHERFVPIRQFSSGNGDDTNGDSGDGNNTGRHRVSLETIKEAQEYAWALTKIIESSRNCKVRWITSDDESYLHDGQPLPTTTAI